MATRMKRKFPAFPQTENRRVNTGGKPKSWKGKTRTAMLKRLRVILIKLTNIPESMRAERLLEKAQKEESKNSKTPHKSKLTASSFAGPKYGQAEKRTLLQRFSREELSHLTHLFGRRLHEMELRELIAEMRKLVGTRSSAAKRKK